MTNKSSEMVIDEVLSVSVEGSSVAKVNEANYLVDMVKNHKINNVREFENSAEFLLKIKLVSKILEDKKKELIKPIKDLEKKVSKFFMDPKNNLDSAEKILKKGMEKFNDEQKAIQVERERIAIAKADALETKKREALEIKAKKEASKGNIEKAELLIEKSLTVNVPVNIIPVKVNKIKGISFKKERSFKINDESLIPREYMIPNEVMIRKVMIASEGRVSIPGIEFKESSKVSASKRG